MGNTLVRDLRAAMGSTNYDWTLLSSNSFSAKLLEPSAKITAERFHLDYS